MTKTSSQFIYQSKGRLFIGLLCVLLFSGLFWSGGFAMLAKNEKPGTLWMTVGLAAVLTFVAVKVIWMLLNIGKPIATIDASGVTLRNGKTFLWSNIEGLHIESMSITFVTLRTDLVIQLTKGKKTVLYVDLTQERLADLIEEARK